MNYHILRHNLIFHLIFVEYIFLLKNIRIIILYYNIMENNLIGKYVKNKRTGKLFGKITSEDSTKVYTNYNDDKGFSFKNRMGRTWEPVNIKPINIKNINGINPESIKKNNSSHLNIYKLKAISNINYECYDSFVISAYTELQARRIAQFKGGDETQIGINKQIPFWTSGEHSSCELLDTNNMGVGVVCGSYNSG